MQLPSRGDIPIHAQRELEMLFSKKSKADKNTNLPVLEHGKTLSPKAAAAWARLNAERAAVREEIDTELTPDWFERVVFAKKKTRGERRAAQRERARLEADIDKLGELGLGSDAEDRDRMEEGGEIQSGRKDDRDAGIMVDSTVVGEHEAM